MEILRRAFPGSIGRRRRHSRADSDGARPVRGGQRNFERRVGNAGSSGAAAPRGSGRLDRAGASEQDTDQSLAVCGLVLERGTVSIPRVSFQHPGRCIGGRQSEDHPHQFWESESLQRGRRWRFEFRPDQPTGVIDRRVAVGQQ